MRMALYPSSNSSLKMKDLLLVLEGVNNVEELLEVMMQNDRKQ
jgi:hypothetical protein